jgi:hypothetical protein
MKIEKFTGDELFGRRVGQACFRLPLHAAVQSPKQG